MFSFVLSDCRGVPYAECGECGGKELLALKTGRSASGRPVADGVEKGSGH